MMETLTFAEQDRSDVTSQEQLRGKAWIKYASSITFLMMTAMATMMASNNGLVSPAVHDPRTAHVPYTNYTRHLARNLSHVTMTENATDAVMVPDEMLSKPSQPRYGNDNGKFPGPFMKNKLHLLGARLTTSYDKFDESVSFDLFGHAVGKGAARGNNDITELDPKEGFPYVRAKQQPFYCRLHEDNAESVTFSVSHSVPMEYIPSSSLDFNTLNAHLIWRCDLSPYISKTDIRKLTHVRVSVYTRKNKFHGNASLPILTVDVPVDTATVGHAGPQIKSSWWEPSFIEKVAQLGPIGVMLCAAGVKKSAMWFLPEWIQHHLNVGVDHIFIGADTKDEMTYLAEKLAYYIEQGIVVLGCEDEVMQHDQVRKLRFYNQCLYHAKGISEYLVIWDVDELWMPPLEGDKAKAAALVPGTNQRHVARHVLRRSSRVATLTPDEEKLLMRSLYPNTMSLIEAVRSLQGENGCTDWCFQTFPSYTIWRVNFGIKNATHPQEQGFYGFPVRDPVVNYIWHKPVIQTKYAYQASFHLAGSCSRANTHFMNYTVFYEKYEGGFSDCPLLSETGEAPLGRMHHFVQAFREYEGVVQTKDYPDYDEYTHQFRRTVVLQLEALQDKVRAEFHEP